MAWKVVVRSSQVVVAFKINRACWFRALNGFLGGGSANGGVAKGSYGVTIYRRFNSSRRNVAVGGIGVVFELCYDRPR